MTEINRLNVRVYGLLINAQNEILLVHEKIGNLHLTKFPGGGLEFGEGTKDCLIREFKEETELDIAVTEHFYTTDFFQQSAFHKTDQIISIYYKVKPFQDPSRIRLDDFEVKNENRVELLRFFWVKLSELNESMITLPIDKIVCSKIKDEMNS